MRRRSGAQLLCELDSLRTLVMRAQTPLTLIMLFMLLARWPWRSRGCWVGFIFGQEGRAPTERPPGGRRRGRHGHARPQRRALAQPSHARPLYGKNLGIDYRPTYPDSCPLGADLSRPSPAAERLRWLSAAYQSDVLAFVLAGL